jgi:hypothetical protein
MTALAREAERALARAQRAFEPRLAAAVRRLPVPKTGIAPDRLRRLVETELPLPRRAARVAALAVSPRLLDLVGMEALGERLLALADSAERRGDAVVPHALVEAVAHEGIVRVVSARLAAVWRTARWLSYGALAVAASWLPVVAALD